MNPLTEKLIPRRAARWDVVGLGTIVVDLLMVLDRYPEVDTKHLATDRLMQIGGPVPTALVTLSRLEHRCSFVGTWGDDPLGDAIERDLPAQNVAIADARRVTGAQSGVAHVWIDRSTGQRTVAYSRCDHPLLPSDVTSLDALQHCRILHLDGWPADASAEAARLVHLAGGLVSLDAGSKRPGVTQLLQQADLINCPRKFLREEFGDDDIVRGLQRLSAGGAALVTVTDGSAGAYLFAEGEMFYQPAFRVDAVDTNGAGDAFCGGLLSAILQDRSPREALECASAVAALKCAGWGNRDPLPTRRALQEFRRRGPRRGSEA